jgi:hypothetical protein
MPTNPDGVSSRKYSPNYQLLWCGIFMLENEYEHVHCPERHSEPCRLSEPHSPQGAFPPVLVAAMA